MKHRKEKKKSPSILWTRRFKYKKKNTHTLKKQRLSDTIIERECLWRRSVILVRVYSTCFRHIVWSKVSGTQLWFIFSFFSSCGDLNLDPRSGFRPLLGWYLGGKTSSSLLFQQRPNLFSDHQQARSSCWCLSGVFVYFLWLHAQLFLLLLLFSRATALQVQSSFFFRHLWTQVFLRLPTIFQGVIAVGLDL